MSSVHTEWHEGCAVLEIRRPEALNALNRTVLEDLHTAWAAVESRDDMRVAVVTGAGSRAFVAGADIQEIHDLTEAHVAADFARLGQAVFQRIADSRLVSIAAVNGFALGGGLELAMACDMRVLADTAEVGQPEIQLGVIPGFGGTQRLTRLVGETRALDLILSGRRTGAETAARWGLATEVVPAARLMEQALELALLLAGKAPLALQLAKKAVRQGAHMSLPHALTLEATLFGLAAASEDAREGTAAFLERRPPKFRGR
jgi:enoyl-CoA hydratase